MAKIAKYVSTRSVSLPTGSGYTGATVKKPTSNTNLGNSLLGIGNMLLEANMRRQTNVKAGANAKILNSKMGDTDFQTNMSRFITDIPQKAMDAGGNWSIATEEMATTLGLDFGNKAQAESIYKAMIQQYDKKRNQFANDKTGFILSTVPGAKELMEGLTQEDQAYHENIRLLAEMHNIKLTSGFDDNYIKTASAEYTALRGVSKIQYLKQKETTMGKDVYQDFTRSLAQAEGTSFSSVDMVGASLPEQYHQLWFSANASKDDLNASVKSNETKDEVKATMEAHLKVLMGGHPTKQDLKKFVLKGRQIAQLLNDQGLNGNDELAKMLKVDKYEKDSDLHIVAMVDEKFLTDKYGAEGTQNIENFMDVANQGVVKEYMFDYLYDEMIKDDPVLLQQIKDELPGADQEVIDKEFNERIKKKLKSNFVDSIRVVNSDDMTQGFAIQHVETIGFMPMYGKTGPLVMPFDELKDYSYRKHRIDPALQDNLFNDFTEILRKAGKE